MVLLMVKWKNTHINGCNLVFVGCAFCHWKPCNKDSQRGESVFVDYGFP